MPPLRHILLRVLRVGSIGAAAFALGVLAIEVWKSGGDLSAIHPGFAMLVIVILGAALWLARAIGREIAAFPDRNGS
jgi:hypothetical protein